MTEQGDGNKDQVILSPAETTLKRQLEASARDSGKYPIQWDAVNDLANTFFICC